MGSIGGSGLNQPATDGIDYDNQALTTSAEELTIAGESGSVLLRAHPNNSDIIFIGWDDSVTTSNGMPLESGDFISLDVDISQVSIFAIAISGGDRVRWITTN